MQTNKGVNKQMQTNKCKQTKSKCKQTKSKCKNNTKKCKQTTCKEENQQGQLAWRAYICQPTTSTPARNEISVFSPPGYKVTALNKSF